MAADRIDYDSPWKEMLEHYFPQFLLFFYPDIYEDIDWTQPHEFMESELQQVVRDAETGRRRVDKVVKVQRLTGEEARVLVHVEVQGQREESFAERMYIYHYRLYDWQRLPVASLAVLTDERRDWRPELFESSLWGVEVRLRFRAVKLCDYRAKWTALAGDPNPFAVVTMAHLKTQETRQDAQARKAWKFTLIRMLYERGYSRAEVLELFRFIDWVMVLPPELERAVRSEIEAYEEAQGMRYVTTIERMAHEEGIEQGTEQAFRRAALDILEERFASVPAEVAAALGEIEEAALLERLVRRAVTVESPAAFAELVRAAAAGDGTAAR